MHQGLDASQLASSCRETRRLLVRRWPQRLQGKRRYSRATVEHRLHFMSAAAYLGNGEPYDERKL